MLEHICGPLRSSRLSLMWHFMVTSNDIVTLKNPHHFLYKRSLLRLGRKSYKDLWLAKKSWVTSGEKLFCELENEVWSDTDRDPCMCVYIKHSSAQVLLARILRKRWTLSTNILWKWISNCCWLTNTMQIWNETITQGPDPMSSEDNKRTPTALYQALNLLVMTQKQCDTV